MPDCLSPLKGMSGCRPGRMIYGLNEMMAESAVTHLQVGEITAKIDAADHDFSTTRSPSPSFGMACTGPEPPGCGGKPLKVASASSSVRQPGRSELVGEWHRERLWNGRCWRKAAVRGIGAFTRLRRKPNRDSRNVHRRHSGARRRPAKIWGAQLWPVGPRETELRPRIDPGL